MSHALADVVHAEQFWVGRGYVNNGNYLVCPASGCLWARDIGDAPTVGEMTERAREHIAEAHTAAAPDELAAVLHAVDAVQGDAYPALIPEAQLADDEDRPVRVCGFTGNTIRGPLFPVEEPGADRVWMCRICFGRHRRSVAHVPSPLPIEGETP